MLCLETLVPGIHATHIKTAEDHMDVACNMDWFLYTAFLFEQSALTDVSCHSPPHNTTKHAQQCIGEHDSKGLKPSILPENFPRAQFSRWISHQNKPDLWRPHHETQRLLKI